MNKFGLLIIFLISHSGIALSGETIQNMLADIQLQDREYDIEFKKWMYVKPELKLRRKVLHAVTPMLISVPMDTALVDREDSFTEASKTLASGSIIGDP